MILRRIVLTLISCIFCNPTLWCHAGPQAAPQTARQALLEMFFSSAPGTFAKHLPLATRTALEKSGALTTIAAVFPAGQPASGTEQELPDL